MIPTIIIRILETSARHVPRAWISGHRKADLAFGVEDLLSLFAPKGALKCTMKRTVWCIQFHHKLFHILHLRKGSSNDESTAQTNKIYVTGLIPCGISMSCAVCGLIDKSSFKDYMGLKRILVLKALCI